MFCTNPDGTKGERAKQWGMVDEIAPPAKFAELVRARAEKLVASSSRPADAKGIKLNPLQRRIDENGYHYQHVDVTFDRSARTATLTVRAPEGNTTGVRSKKFTRSAISGGRWRWRASWTTPS